MSSKCPSIFPSLNHHNGRDIDDTELNLPTIPFDATYLSPFAHFQTLSNSASPTYTPGESDYSPYQASELEHTDLFFGMNFDDAGSGVQRVDSLPVTAIPGNVECPFTYRRMDLNRPLPAIPPQPESQAATATSNNSWYPISPIHSSIHNTPSPNCAANDIKSNTTIPQHELTGGLHSALFQSRQSLAPTVPSAQLTPDLSGSSDTSAESLELGTMPPRPKQSPRLTVSNCEDGQQPHCPYPFVQSSLQYGAINIRDLGGHVPVQKPGNRSHSSVQRGEDGSWPANKITGQRGLDPETRKAVGKEEILTLKEEENKQKTLHKNREVEEWVSQATASRDTEQLSQAPGPDNGILPLDDGASLHENRLVEGQIYFDLNSDHINETDRTELVKHPGLWKDGPSVPYITTSSIQPETANEAMMKFNSQSDSMSMISRAATWGTRRKSEPSLADFEGVSDGSFLKKLSIASGKGREGNRPRQNSIFDQGLDRLANFARKRSDSKLKRTHSTQNIPEEAPQYPRHNSQDTLAPPIKTPSFSKRPTPSINTAFAAMAGPLAAVGITHTRRTSFGATTTSPKSPVHLGFNILKRARSRSELTSQEKQTGLVKLWMNQGGPPVLASPPTQVEASRPEPTHLDSHDREEDDDEDDEVDENDMKLETEHKADPIEPTHEGFKAHIRRLNPDMDQQYKWLVSRIARQQVIRYKNLLELRVKHSRDVNARNCSARHHCLALPGSIGRAPSTGLHLVTDFSEDDSNPGEGALTEDTFPQGVPMPPTKNLPAEFECQLCFKSKKFQKPSDWTKHVHEDVQPFTCTYESCKEPKSFKRKADWVRHENERHRHLEWWICQVEDCRHTCYRKDNFLQHLVREHKFPEPKQKTKAAIKKARLTEPAWIMLEQCHHETLHQPQDEHCKFCGRSFPTWKKLTVHLAKHMEYISLPILRLVEAKTVDENSIISPIGEQNLTPLTPIGRAKMESHSPFNIDSFSPHVAPDSLFSTTGFEQPSYFTTAGPSSGYSMQSSMPQELHYNDSNNSQSNQLYTNFQNMDQTRGFNNIGSSNTGNSEQSRAFGSLASGFAHPKVEQPRGFGSMDSDFSHAMLSQDYNMQQTSGYSIPQTFSAAPPGYQTSHLLGVSESGLGFGFDPIAVNGSQNFTPLPMSRAHGSASSYGHSPQNVPQLPYYGQQ